VLYQVAAPGGRYGFLTSTVGERGRSRKRTCCGMRGLSRLRDFRRLAQPWVRAVLDDADLLACFGQQAVGEFGVRRDRFLRHKADEALVRDALLTLDGSWVTPASRRDDDYVSFFNTYVDELAPDTVLVNITYHS
jgi:hypothetical protein